MNVVLIGPPGSGKGTQAPLLSKEFGLKHLSTGEIFREEISKKTALGEKVQAFVTKGALVPDEVVVEVVGSKLQAGQSYLLDGFPRTLAQAEAFDKQLSSTGRRLDAVVYLNVAAEEVVRRLGARWTCPKCNAVYNLLTQPPKQQGLCDKDGASIFQREDDKPEAIRRRMSVYEDATRPLVAYYKGKGVLLETDGSAAPETVFGEVRRALGPVVGARN